MITLVVIASGTSPPEVGVVPSASPLNANHLNEPSFDVHQQVLHCRSMYQEHPIFHSMFQFMKFFHATMPVTTLEDHTGGGLVHMHGVGFGMMGEQVAESIHAWFNGLART